MDMDMPEPEPGDNMDPTTTLSSMGNTSGTGNMSTMGNMPGMSSGASGMHMSMNMPGMTMYFHDGYQEYILFLDLLTKSKGAFAGACIAVFFLGVFYELLKHGRELLQRRFRYSKVEAYKVNGNSEDMHVSNIMRAMFSSAHLLQTVLHGIQILVSYCLMLLFMTYNAYLCLCVVLGITFGYFLVGWNRASVEDTNEPCH